MLPTIRRAPSLAAALLLLAACDATPVGPRLATTAPSRTTVVAATSEAPGEDPREEREYVYDMDGSVVTFFCADGRESEPVALSGRIRERETYVSTPDGTVRFRLHAKPDGLEGVGTVTGQPYRVVEREQTWGHYAERGVVGLHRTVWTLRARDTMETFTLTYTLRFTMDENRDIVFSREWERAECR